MRTPLTYEIVSKETYVEVHASGTVSHWDLLKIIHQLHRDDPKKTKPDLWVLDENLEFSLYSFPPIIQGIAALIARNAVRNGCRSAILAADEFQKAKVEFYCTEAAAVLPFEIRAFTSCREAVDWLHYTA